MAIISRYHKKCRIAFLKISIIATAMAAFCIPVLHPYESVGDNIFTLYVNGNEIGKVDNVDDADRLLNTARRIVAGADSSITLIEAKTEIVGAEVLRGSADDEEEMVKKIVEEFTASKKETMQHSYTVKIDEFKVNVSSANEVIELLNASIHKYDEEKEYGVSLVADSTRELPVLVPTIGKKEVETEEEETVAAYQILGNGGFYAAFNEVLEEAHPEEELSFADYDYGITNLSFANNVEVIEAYLPSKQVSRIEDAIEEVTKEKEQKTIYEVVSGDTLSGIAAKTGITVDDIIKLNDSIKNINSVIRIGDEITVTVPQPELSVARDEIVYYEGTYEAEIQYVYNDDWYTTTEVTLQDPSSGYHKAVQKVSYLNDEVVSTETIMEEVVAEAIPKIVEKGTKIPPTYIKPISGGIITSYFGGRSALIKGMTTYHGAIDWATPTGTSVVASCGGTVTYAGWMSSYGYVVFINHPDGRQTRYAHLSRVLVSVGQSVSQGQKIALSGSTGVSTGPHVHFEMRIGGKAVNPLNYISY